MERVRDDGTERVVDGGDKISSMTLEFTIGFTSPQVEEVKDGEFKLLTRGEL